MLRGYCLDVEILPTNILFYLFPHGKHNFYASRFPKKGSHTGSVRRSMFSIVEETEGTEWPLEPPKKTKPIELNVVFSAKLIWCYDNYQTSFIGKTCFVIARGKGLHVDVYADAELKCMLGCYPIHWFESFNVPRAVRLEQLTLF